MYVLYIHQGRVIEAGPGRDLFVLKSAPLFPPRQGDVLGAAKQCRAAAGIWGGEGDAQQPQQHRGLAEPASN